MDANRRADLAPAGWRPRRAVGSFLLLVVLSAIDSAVADTWRWRDAEGKLNFGDSPPAGVPAERVRVAPPRSPLSPEEAEREVGLLREKADREMQQAEVGRKAAAAAAARSEEQHAQALQRCGQAKQALFMLKMERPVYQDDEGRFRIKRPPGQGDPYTGTRNYLDDATRAAEIRNQQAIIAETCSAPLDEADETRLADEAREREACESAAAELDQAQQQEMRPAPEEEARLRRFLAEECQTP